MIGYSGFISREKHIEYTVHHFATRDTPIGYIDGKRYVNKLKNRRTWLFVLHFTPVKAHHHFETLNELNWLLVYQYFTTLSLRITYKAHNYFVHVTI